MRRVVFIVLLVLLSAGTGSAAVTGECINCHTMHDSQAGQALLADGPAQSLLVSDCVGCHSSASANTILQLGSTRVPIVFNPNGGLQYPANGEPNSALAGGNFYWVVKNGDNYGHNVFGISGLDSKFPIYPGAPGSGIYTGNEDCRGCHGTLSEEGGGCQGCHFPRHHLDGGKIPVTAGENGWYRFLGGAMDARLLSVEDARTAPGVIGVEDPNWEQNPSSTQHNVYKGTDLYYNRSYYPQDGSIGSFCSGCHGKFHSQMGTVIWLRHPSDVALPGVGSGKDYAAYTTYNPLAPVAKQVLDGSVGADVVPGEDLVTCLSCHRAHGSPYPDMLRWDYQNDCAAGVANEACGCFVCHTSKDDF